MNASISRKSLRPSLLLCFLFGSLVFGAERSQATEDPGIDACLEQMEKIKGDVFASVEEQFGGAKGVKAPREWVLTLDRALLHYANAAQLDPTGIRLEDAVLRFFSCGTRLSKPQLSSASRALQRRLWVEQFDATGLKWDGQKLSGTISALTGRISMTRDYGEGRNMHSALKARVKPVTNWHIGGMKRVFPKKQTFSIEADVNPKSVILEVTLDAFAGEERKASPPDPENGALTEQETIGGWFGLKRKPLVLKLTHEDGGWREAHGRTPSWNRAFHRVDTSKLVLTDQALSGALCVTLVPDPWVPAGNKVRKIQCRIDAPIHFGSIQGSYSATGDQGAFTGSVRGVTWQEVQGTFRVEGVDGTFSGILTGKVRNAPGAANDIPALQKKRLRAMPGLDGASELAPLLDAYRLLHAGLLGRKRLPLSVDTMFHASLTMPAPQVDDPTRLKAYAEALLDFAKTNAAPGPEPLLGNVSPEDVEFGPFIEVAEMKTEKLPATVGQTGTQSWLLPGTWRTAGPFERRRRLRWQPSRLPAVVPVDGVRYRVPRLKIAKDIFLERSWKDATLREGKVLPDPESWRDTFVQVERLVRYGKHPANQGYYARQNGSRSYVWYAATNLIAAADAEAWVGIRARDFARVWVNGRQVWDSGPKFEAWRANVFKVPLKKGANRVLVECGKQRITYHAPLSFNRSEFTFWVCGRGQPRTPEQLAAAKASREKRAEADAAMVQGYWTPSGRTYPNAVPPFSWNLEKNWNIAWRVPVKPDRSPIVVSGEKLFCTHAPNQLVCLNKKDGKLLWTGTCQADGLAEGAGSTAPVVTDDRVWVYFGNGVAGCFDHEGKRLWAVNTGIPWRGGVKFSPLLCDGKLIIGGQIPAPRENKELVRHQFAALDAASGKAIWRSAEFKSRLGGYTGLHLTSGNHRKSIIVTANGRVLDAADGKLKFSRQFSLSNPMTPSIGGNRAYLLDNRYGQAALHFWLDDLGRLGCRKIWEIRRGGSSSNQITTPGLVRDGLWYIGRSTDESGGHHPVPWDQLDVYEVARGQHLARPNPVIVDSRSPVPVVFAGKYVVCSDSGQGQRGSREPKAAIAIVTLGDDPRLLSRQEFRKGKMYSAPVFDGPRMFIRLDGEIICITNGGEKARSVELAAVARTIISAVGSQPRKLGLLDPDPLPAGTDLSEAPVSTLEHNIPPDRWLVAGPFPRMKSKNAEGIENVATFVAVSETKVKANGVEAAFAPLPEKYLLARSMVRVYRSSGVYYHPTTAINLTALLKGKTQSSTYFFTVLASPREQVARLDLLRRNTQVWLGGKPIRNGELAAFPRGYVPLLVRLDAGRMPPFAKVLMSLKFNSALSPRKAMANWLDRIRSYQKRLKEVVAELPDTAHAVKARGLLEALETHAAVQPK